MVKWRCERAAVRLHTAGGPAASCLKVLLCWRLCTLPTPPHQQQHLQQLLAKYPSDTKLTASECSPLVYTLRPAWCPCCTVCLPATHVCTASWHTESSTTTAEARSRVVSNTTWMQHWMTSRGAGDSQAGSNSQQQAATVACLPACLCM